ncbi:MAG: GWxTD domain-containing protein [Silvibacterium sp.]
MRIKRLLGHNETQAPQLAVVTLLAIFVAATALCIGVSARAQSDSGSGTALDSHKVQTLSGPYSRWLNQDVRWIITPEERAAYLSLKTGQERDQFIKQFWERRNPPGAPPYTFREEHYRRIAYANEHFANSIPGWETDQGHIYIVYGPPDSIDAHPSGGNSLSMPFEVWHYRQVQGYAPPGRMQGAVRYKAVVATRENVDFTFVDVCSCGKYQLHTSSKN